ncbi:DNA-3-methyladenine glycosylase [Vibrio maritimus]|uniref:DNA-3-methyladenine glycosylase n=1 Tax=Vibrio maritimus TaxID=990268 RepID=A0A090T1M9_9VIBR|nr:DNA-3-methyladenine glycosylase [Vibrio maritimus]
MLVSSYKALEDYPATSKVSDALSKDLKKRGFKFVGSTIIYAFLQAAGLSMITALTAIDVKRSSIAIKR